MAAAAAGSPPRLGAPSPSPGVAPLFGQPGPLAGLEDFDARIRYRERPESEREEAIWYLPDAVNALAEPTPVRLRSVHSKQASVIRFCNKSARSVRALWVDFDGHEVAYSLIEPGTTRLYRTYATHPWIVRELTTGARMMLSGAAAVVGMAEEQSVDITDPPELGWGLGTHRCFPGDFKTAARQLLLAHHRLATAPPTAAAKPCAVSAAAQPVMVASPPCSPLCTATGGPVAALTTTTTRLQLSTPQTQLSIAITTDAPAADCSDSSGGMLVSPLSPRRTINITVNATGSSLGVNIESTTEPSAALADVPSRSPADQMLRSPVRPPPSPAARGRRAIVSGIKNSFSGIKGLMSPGRGASARAVHGPAAVGAGAEAAARSDSLGVDLRLESPPAPDVGAAGGTDLGALPHHLVVRIVELAAPKQWQGVHMPRVGRPDVRPTQLACPPDTKTQREEDAEAAAAAAQHMQPPEPAQQQQGGGAAQPLNAAVAALNAFIQQGWHGVWGPLGQGAAPAAGEADDMPALGEDDGDEGMF